MKYYKVLDGNKSANGGSYKWSLPVKNEDGSWTPGEWSTPVEGELVACSNGYHLADAQQLAQWLDKDIYEAEGEEMQLADDKTKWVCRRARLLRKVEAWNDRTARLFAVWCAREALKLIEKPDPRSVAACDVAERYANGEATYDELSAARDAAGAAAWDAAGDAARAAAWAAQSERLLEMLGE